MALAQAAVTHYVTASTGIRFAYRRIGPANGIPLAMHIHYRANMDLWDPLFINTLATFRPVIIFDNAGVGRSTGEVPQTYQGWADDAIAFIEALGLKKVDFLGFSMGGYAAQMVALTAPHLVRKLILGGTSATTPSADHVAGVVWPRENAPPGPIKALSEAVTREEGRKALAFSFFFDDNLGRAAFGEYWSRLQQRTVEPLLLDLLDRDAGAKRQYAAAVHAFTASPSGSFDRLNELKMPVLVANGDNDVLIPSSRSWELMTQIPNAQLIIYPRAGHGFLWQFAELYATHINMFLDGTDFDDLVPKL
ncbi:Alpha/Beta hydrolase protein [Exophiala viscosa]|uniref:Alpha/Beta hydrolase protein n=1 Tax=Exophiala viscosa TaxID=2486360 RepID=UPI0021939B48|nr:Alpha/Beta hydrolase protein [Exophiala viscosa]